MKNDQLPPLMLSDNSSLDFHEKPEYNFLTTRGRSKVVKYKIPAITTIIPRKRDLVSLYRIFLIL